MTTVNVYVLLRDLAQFLERTAPDSPLVKLVAQENCAYLIKFGEVDIMAGRVDALFSRHAQSG